MAFVSILANRQFVSILVLMSICVSARHYGQRIYADVMLTRFIDPNKHGFHLVLDDSFVESYLRPTHLPALFASAVPLEESPNVSGDLGRKRATKIVYPNDLSSSTTGQQIDDGFLDGRMVKLTGLRPRTWYYVCVEFESYDSRYEVAFGADCRLKRTLDNYGRSAASTLTHVELTGVGDRSLRFRLISDAQFPRRLDAFLKSDDHSVNVPVRTFFINGRRSIDLNFDSDLTPNTTYGRLCFVEQPLLSLYTPTGRLIDTRLEVCYFDSLTTSAETTMTFDLGTNARSAVSAVSNNGLADFPETAPFTSSVKCWKSRSSAVTLLSVANCILLFWLRFV